MKYLLTLISGFVLGYLKGKLSNTGISCTITYKGNEKDEEDIKNE